MLMVQLAYGQKVYNTAPPSTDSLVTVRADTGETNNRMDIIDLFRLMAKKLVKKKPNLLLRNENSPGPFVVAIPYPGYTIATGVTVVVPVNISFYTNPKERTILSFFNNNFQYTQYQQIIAQSLSNIYLGHDKWELLGDYRFYRFPTYTYGLGSFTTLGDIDQISYSQVRIYQLVMREIMPKVSAGIGYHFDYHYHITDFNAQNGITTDFQQYGLTTNSISSGLSLNFLYDGRDNTNNPIHGFYFNAQFRSNLQALGSSSNYNSLTIDLRKYFRLPTKWYTEIALWSYSWFTTNGMPPYLDLPTTAGDTYNNTGRGYALGRFRGLNMLYFEAEFRFSIMRNGFLGGVVFANAESLSEYPGNNFAAFQPGVGLGLRIKLNKRTNTNSAVDYGFGTGGSRGFAFNLNEVF